MPSKARANSRESRRRFAPRQHLQQLHAGRHGQRQRDPERQGHGWQSRSRSAPQLRHRRGALRILEAAGIDPTSGIQRRQLGAAETVAALRDGTIDAGFWSGGLPTGALIDLAGDGDMKLLPIGRYADPARAEIRRLLREAGHPGQHLPRADRGRPGDRLAEHPGSQQENGPAASAGHHHRPLREQGGVGQGPSRSRRDDKTTAGKVAFVETCPGSKADFDKAGS